MEGQRPVSDTSLFRFGVGDIVENGPLKPFLWLLTVLIIFVLFKAQFLVIGNLILYCKENDLSQLILLRLSCKVLLTYASSWIFTTKVLISTHTPLSQTFHLHDSFYNSCAGMYDSSFSGFQSQCAEIWIQFLSLLGNDVRAKAPPLSCCSI